MYNHGYSYRGVVKKPKLIKETKELRLKRAQVLRKVIKETPKLLAFLDAASI